MSNEESTFDKYYAKVLEELDVLYQGVYDPQDAAKTAALCLLAQASLIKIQSSADLRARALKRDIDFAKAEVYHALKAQPSEKKLTEVALTHLINKDDAVQKIIQEQNMAEKEAKELSNVLALLKDAHITFRSFAKTGE